jgi:uncharacterized protein with GYD domain
MPRFMFQAAYGPEGVAGVADKGGSARRDAIQQLFEANGGRMEAFYFALGETDAFVIGELPDVKTATAVNRTGVVTVRTVALLTPEEVDEAAKTSIDYRPPGS